MPRLPYFDRESGAHGWPSPPRSPLSQPVGSGMDPDVRGNPHARAVECLKQVAKQTETTTTNKAHADDKDDNDDNAEKAIKYITVSPVIQECGRVVEGAVGQEGLRAMPRLQHLDCESGAHGWPSPPRSPRSQPIGSGMDPDVQDHPHARAVERLKHIRPDAPATSIGIAPPPALAPAPTPAPAAGASTPCGLPLQPSRAQDSHGHLDRALVAVGVARPGIMRIGTEPDAEDTSSGACHRCPGAYYRCEQRP